MEFLKDNCQICDSISLIQKNLNKYFVAELETGYVVLGDRQYFKGYTLFLCKEHFTELHFLEKKFKKKFLLELSLISEAVYNAFKPHKLNYELLGNVCPHLHWHIFPRYKNEPGVKDPVWFKNIELAKSDEFLSDENELKEIKTILLNELKNIEGINFLNEAKL
ncbi:MAG TPA: HIT family protein [Ignavibacteria bacterium]|nr:HIT family protein [Ignavibacteria bacterium]